MAESRNRRLFFYFRLRAVFALAGSTVLLTACLQPARHQALPQTQLPSQWLWHEVSDASVENAPSRWWQTFDDPALDRLIDEALAANTDLAAASMRASRARLRAGLAASDLAPRVEANIEAAATHAFDAPGVRRFSGTNVGLLYEIDAWGRLAARRDEAAWRAQASEADREAAALSLIGTTARLYWQIGWLNHDAALADADIADAEQALALATARRAAGAVSALDIAQAQQDLAEQRAACARLLQQREERRHALSILFGRPPQQRAAEPADLPSAALPSLRAGLPVELLARRPDLRAQELRVRALLANVDATRASLYPRFTLTGELGTASDALMRTLSNPTAALGAALAFPFVQWNTMRYHVPIAQSEYEEALLAFRQTLYRALSQVEDALSARKRLDDEAAERARSLDAAQRAAELAEARFRAGKTNLAPWLETRRTLRAAQRASAANRLAQFENRLSLYLALGGGQG
jgi:NodT family efflux transporter outer membrane factor (OMF) lipoprotein